MSRFLALLAIPALASLTVACDTGTSGDESRYQKWAQSVSTIPLDPASGQTDGTPSQIDLQPAEKAPADNRLRVELLTPHQLWDARNGPLKMPTMEVLENISPTELVHATVVPAPSRAPSGTATPQVLPASRQPTKVIQLGAFSSEPRAREAWQRLQTAMGSAGISNLEPRFETVEVSGRQLVRLRIATTDAEALTLCQALTSNDPWCKSPAP